MWIYWSISDDWVYDTLDFLDAGNLRYYIALPFLILVAFWIVYGLVSVREASAKQCGVKSRRVNGFAFVGYQDGRRELQNGGVQLSVGP
jgi:hypothetical protein